MDPGSSSQVLMTTRSIQLWSQNRNPENWLLSHGKLNWTLSWGFGSPVASEHIRTMLWYLTFYFENLAHSSHLESKSIKQNLIYSSMLRSCYMH